MERFEKVKDKISVCLYNDHLPPPKKQRNKGRLVEVSPGLYQNSSPPAKNQTEKVGQEGHSNSNCSWACLYCSGVSPDTLCIFNEAFHCLADWAHYWDHRWLRLKRRIFLFLNFPLWNITGSGSHTSHQNLIPCQWSALKCYEDLSSAPRIEASTDLSELFNIFIFRKQCLFVPVPSGRDKADEVMVRLQTWQTPASCSKQDQYGSVRV